METVILALLEYYQMGRYEDAERLGKSIVKKFPTHQLSWKVLGVALKRAGKMSESLSANQKAVELEPKDWESHSNLGNTLKEVGRLVDAEASYRKAIALKPDFAEAYCNLGITLQELGRLEEAEASYRKAIALKPEFAEAHGNLGDTLQEGNNAPAALHAAITSIKIKPTAEAKGLFIKIAKKLNFIFWDLSLSNLVITALLEPWGRPSDVVPAACRLLKTDTEFFNTLNTLRIGINEGSYGESFIKFISEKKFYSSPLLNAIYPMKKWRFFLLPFVVAFLKLCPLTF